MKTVFVTILLVAAAAWAGAQVPVPPPAPAPAPAKANSETRVFGLELGTGFSYDLGAKTSNPTQIVSAVFGLTEAVQAGFSILKGDAAGHNFVLTKISVYPVPDVAVQFAFGADGTPTVASGFGLAYNAFRSTSAGLTTALQIAASYLFTSPATGNLGLGLNLKVGL